MAGNDPALLSKLPAPRGRPVAWECEPGKAGWRSWILERRHDGGNRRHALAGISSIEAGPGFASRLDASIKDYARGAGGGLPFFSDATDNIPAASVRGACSEDPRVYRLWVGPYNGGNFINRAFVRSFMGRVEQGLGCRLAWFGAVHQKPTVAFTEHRHFHVIIRGSTSRGYPLKMKSRGLLSGFVTIAEDLLTDLLGPMSDAEIAKMEEVRQSNSPRSHNLTMLRRAGFKAWEIQRFDGVAR